ncbi:MAG: hypothetical protein ACP5KI_02660 [Brevinematia bacterium]
MDATTQEIMEKLRSIIGETMILEQQVQKLKDLVSISENDILKVKEGVLVGFHHLSAKVNNLEKIVLELNEKVDRLLSKE